MTYCLHSEPFVLESNEVEHQKNESLRDIRIHTMLLFEERTCWTAATSCFDEIMRIDAILLDGVSLGFRINTPNRLLKAKNE